MYSFKIDSCKRLIFILFIVIFFSCRMAIAADNPSSTTLTQKTLIDQWKAFIPKLADCIPGTYRISVYLKPIDNTQNPMYITYKLSGWVNNKCIVNIDLPRIDPSAYMVSECKFSKELINGVIKTFENQDLPTNDLRKMATTPIISTQIFRDCDTYFYAKGIKSLIPKPGVLKSEIKLNSTQNLSEYNKIYNTSVQNLDQLQADMTKRITDYSEKLRACTPGTYQFTFAGTHLTYIKSTIIGKHGDLCLTETSYLMKSQGNYTVKCEFQPQTLIDVANFYPDFALLNKSPLTRPFSKKAMDECKTITHP